MPATASRIAFVLSEFRTAVAGPDSAVDAKYGALARDTRDEPVESFFEILADAQAMVDERHGWLSLDRRRFRQDMRGANVGLELDYSQETPTALVIDDERARNHHAAIVEIGVQFGEDRTILTTWG